MSQTALYWMLGVGAFAGGLLAGTLSVWFWSRSATRRMARDWTDRLDRMAENAETAERQLETERDRLEAARRENADLRIALAETGAGERSLTARLTERTEDWRRLQAESQTLRTSLARMETRLAADAENLKWRQEDQERMRETFESLSHRVLKSQAADYLDRHQLSMTRLMDPVREHLDALNTHVRELENRRQGAYEGLVEQIRQLSGANARLESTTVTLAEALKSPTVRGRWGEIQLRRVVEMAGMIPHVDFSEQVQVNGGRPDMVIHLPNSGKLAVDAKAPMAAYMEAMAATDAAARADRLAAHARAMRERVRDLAGKRYWARFDSAPDFVVMFVPNEACLGAAFEKDPDLLDYAIGQQVLIATPMTLLAMLKSVAHGWQQYRLTENTRQIAAQGQALHQRLETFLSHFGELGRQLDKTVAGYNRAIGSLERRLMPIARRFQEMAVAPSALECPEEITRRARPPADAADNHPIESRKAPAGDA